MLLIKYVLEYVEAIKGSKDDLRYVIKVRNWKGVIFRFDLLWTSGVTLKFFGQHVQEYSSVSSEPIELNDGSINSEGVRVNKHKSKVWKKFIP